MGRLEDVLIDPFGGEIPREKPLEKVSPKEEIDEKEQPKKQKEKIETKKNKKSKKSRSKETPKKEGLKEEKKHEAVEKTKPLVRGSEKSVLEAALFMGSDPIKLEELGKISGIGSIGYLKKILNDLAKDYEGRGIEIVERNDCWIMKVRTEYINKVSNLTPYSDLSDGCKRTLALVVYKDPVKQSEIIEMQGNKAYAYIKALVKRGLITTEKIGRTKVLKLTREFENYFGEEIDKVKERVRQAIAQEQAEKESVLVQ